MPAVVEKRGSKFVVLAHRNGKVLGKHGTKSAAAVQQQAVNASLSKRGKI